jgi:hypothetical protein
MGLFVYRVRFDSAPPSEVALRAQLTQQAGSAYADALDDFDLKGNIVEITAALNPVTGPYAVKILLDLGGAYLDFSTREPCDPQLPEYVCKPWPAWPWWKRAGINARFLLGLLSTALPLHRRAD